MTEKEFVRKMTAAKIKLLTSKGFYYTCNIINDEFFENEKTLPLYRQFIRNHLDNSSSLGWYKNNNLPAYEMLFRRYIILDSFEQEMLQSKGYKKL